MNPDPPSDETMIAAGLRESNPRELVIPALIATALACAAVAAGLSDDPDAILFGGSADAHRSEMNPLFAAAIGLLVVGATIGGVFSRSRLSTLMLFNMVSAFASSLCLSLVLFSFHVADIPSGLVLGMVLGVVWNATNWGASIMVMQMLGAGAGHFVGKARR